MSQTKTNYTSQFDTIFNLKVYKSISFIYCSFVFNVELSLLTFVTQHPL